MDRNSFLYIPFSIFSQIIQQIFYHRITCDDETVCELHELYGQRLVRTLQALSELFLNILLKLSH